MKKTKSDEGKHRFLFALKDEKHIFTRLRENLTIIISYIIVEQRKSSK
jgi:hypothetical protein